MGFALLQGSFVHGYLCMPCISPVGYRVSFSISTCDSQRSWSLSSVHCCNQLPRRGIKGKNSFFEKHHGSISIVKITHKSWAVV